MSNVARIKRTAKDYIVNPNTDLIVFEINVSSLKIEDDKFVINESTIRHQSEEEVLKTGCALTEKHFKFYKDNRVASSFLNSAVTLTSAVTAFEHSLCYSYTDRVHIKLHLESATEKLILTLSDYLKRYCDLCEFAQFWMPNNISVELTYREASVPNFESESLLDVKELNFVIGSNGGKDSTLSTLLLEKQGFEAYKVDLYKSHLGYLRDVSDKSGIVSHQVYKNKEARNYFSDLSIRYSKYIAETRAKVSFDSQTNLSLLYFMPYFIHCADTGAEPRFVVLGSEWGCSTEWLIEGKIVPDLAFEEGIYVKKVFQELTAASGYKTKTEIISPIAGLFEVAIINLLNRMGSSWTLHDSCWWREYVFLNDTPACEFCHKCLRNKLIINSLNQTTGYDFNFIDNRSESVIKTSPSMYCYSIASNNSYYYLRGDPKDSIDYAVTMLESEEIKDFVGRSIYDDTVAIIKSYGFGVVEEPKYDFDLDLIPRTEVIESILQTFYGNSNHWESLPNQSYEDSTTFVSDFTLPFEDDFLLDHFDTYPLYSHFNVWKFYKENGDLVKVKVVYSNNPLLDQSQDLEVPDFENAVVQNSLRWSDDKMKCLESYIRLGMLTSFEILN